jgi:peroxisomal 3,2-trans-enoyl-CoA isomerase
MLFKKELTTNQFFFTLLTGVGSTYSNGTDLLNDSDIGFEEHLIAVRDFVRAFINYPKLLVALVNGPAVGIACTTLGLCDLVYATKMATFSCPFHRMGLTAEGCSTITFPLIIGKTRAAKFLYSGETMNAYDALKIGFINEIIDNSINGRNKLINKIKNFMLVSELPILHTKHLMLQGIIPKDELLKANDREIERLKERFNSDDFQQSINHYLQKKMLKNKL